jgi:chemotaxis protein CheX
MATTYDSMIEQIVQSIFATMLNTELVRVEHVDSCDHDSLLATIQISGQWTGCVVLNLSPELSTYAAANMLQMSESEVTAADIKDTAAELVNMVGGNLKSLLPAPSFLSLPTVVTGSEFGLQVHKAELLEDVSLMGEQGGINVRVYTQTHNADKYE